MLDWTLTITAFVAFAALIAFSNSKLGKVRKDGRPQQLPWGFIMITSAFALLLVIVHIMNLVGIETGPENSLFGRF